ncbi:LysR family transcriptional regulator [Methylocystis parvus]|uniref:LysR family transcriptional regulator n=1 Tax=Methylocystis parvus TaxID=134 RepID=UPI003C7182EF
MDRLNYQHLFYFWNVAREGSVTRASEKLRLAQPTISGQLAVFEDAIGAQLLRKEGRKLALTEKGRTVYNYADEIFALGRELTNTLKGRSGALGHRLSVGVADALPKLLVYRLVEPSLRNPEDTQVVLHEDKVERLLAELSLHGVDIVLSDAPATASIGGRVYNHLLGECGVAVFGAAHLAVKYMDDFPRSLEGAPLLFPTPATALRRSLDLWFERLKIFPNIRAEIEDSALMKTFAAAGVGLFVAPLAVREEIERQYGVLKVGCLDGVTETFYAITVRRKVDHPAITAILENAKNWLVIGDPPASAK